MKIRFLLPVITIAALVFVLSGLNKPIVSPVPSGIDSTDIYAYVSSPDAAVVIDAQQKRALFLNSRGQLIKIVDKNIFSNTYYFFDSPPVIKGDDIWLVESTYKPGDIFVSKDRVLRYSKRGKLLGSVLEFKYDLTDPDQFTTSSQIKYLEIEDNTGLAYLDKDNEHGSIVSFNPYKLSAMEAAGSWNAAEYRDNLPDTGRRFIPFSPGFAFRNALFWFSALYLVLFAIFQIFRYLLKLLRTRDLEQLKKIYTGAIIFMVAAFLVLFYSHQIDRLSRDNETRMLRNAASQLVDRINDAERTYDNVYNTLTQNAISARLAHISYIPVLYARDKDNKFTCVVSAKNQLPAGVDLNISTHNTVQLLRNPWGEYLCVVVPFEDESGGILIYSDFFSMRNAIAARNLMLLLTIVSMAIAGMFLLSESKACFECFRLYAQSKLENSTHSEFHLVRPLYFISIAPSSALIAVGVLIGKDIIDTTRFAGNTLIASLPLLMISAGSIIGLRLFSLLTKKIHTKTLLISASIIALFSYTALIMATARNNLLFYLIFILTSVTASFTCVSYTFRLILHAPDKESQNEANKARVVSNLSASILIGIASGYIAQYVGNSCVFGLSLFFQLLTCIIFCYLKIDDEKIAKKEKVSVSNIKMIKFMTSPGMLCVIMCLVVTFNLACSFSGFVFKYTAFSKGLSKSIISTISVLYFSISFQLTPFVNKKIQSIGNRRASAYICIVMAALFILPIITDSLIIYVLLMFAFGPIVSNLEITSTMIWPRLAEKAGIPLEAVNSRFITINLVVRLLRTPFAGAIMGLGHSVLFIVYSIYFLAAGFVMNLYARKDKES